jgi:hypothetical protein
LPRRAVRPRVGPGTARDLVGPSEQSVQVRAGGGRDDAGATDDDLPAGPVDGDAGAFGDGPPAGAHRGAGDVDGEAGDPHDGRSAQRPRHHGGVAGRPATGGDDAGGGGQAVQVERGGLRTYQDDRAVRGHPGRGVGGGRDPADGDPRAGTQPPGEHVGLVDRRDAGDADVPELLGRHPEQRLAAPDHTLVGEVGGHADRGVADEPARSHLQEPQLAGLEGELQLACVAVAALDPVQGVQEAGPHGRFPVGQLVQGPGPASARDDVVALATEQDLTERGGLAGVGVAAERHPAAAVVVAVPEHHRLDGHGRAEMVRDAMELTVGPGPRRVP